MRSEKSRHGALCRIQSSTTEKGISMGCHTSPLESLAAFAIVFAVGVLSTVSFGKYVEKLKEQAEQTH